MKAARQITIAMANRPGRLAHFCACLAERKVNITAISVADTADQCIVRMVVDRPAAVEKMLKDHCPMTWSVQQVVVASLSNKPGVLARLAEKLAANKVNINYLYGSTTKVGAKSTVVLGVSSVKKALDA